MSSRTSLLACLLVLMGCEPWQASNQRDYKAKKFGYPHRDRAKIYVYREAESLAGPSPFSSLTKLFTMDLFLDGMEVGTMEPGSFALLTVRPGPHTLVSRFRGEDAELTLDATGGWGYYVALERGRPDCIDCSELLLVERETGRDAIRDLRLIKHPPPPLDPAHPPSTPPPPSADLGPTPARLSGRP